MLNAEYLCMNKYGKDFLSQLFCNKLLCFTAYIYTRILN